MSAGLPSTPEISPDALRACLESPGGAKPLLIDVRQPEEYAEGHLPGARLIPLMELPGRLGELPKDAETVFYCRSGARSARAVEESLRRGSSRSASLSGGMLAWEGAAVPDFPKLRVFDASGDLAGTLRRAMELEKGAERFYRALTGLLEGTPARGTVAALEKAETAHARALYVLLAGLGCGDPEGFERAYAALPGDILEGGESLESALADAKAFGEGDPGFLLETALEMELRALDLYSALARDASDPKTQSLLRNLSEAERAHALRVAKAIGTCRSRP